MTKKLDYHNFTTIDTSTEERSKLHVGDIYMNAVRCDLCKDEIRSCNMHDYVTCKCGNVSVDGGSWYLRRSFKTDQYTDISINFKDAKVEDEN